MGIRNLTLQQAIDALTQTTTTETAFQNAMLELISQVQKDSEDLQFLRTIELTGDVSGLQIEYIITGRR